MPSKNAHTTTQGSTTSASTKQLPIQTLRLGRIKAAIWENEADRKKFYNVTFARVYTGEDKQPHDTDSFGRDDLPLVAKLADRAHTYVFERLAELRAESQGE